MKRLAYLAVIAAFVVGCGGAAPTPVIVYVTPEPTVAVTPSPSPSPTPTPDTSGDARVDSFIRDGFDELTGYIGDITTAADVFEMVGTYREMGSFAKSEGLKAVALDPSPCIRPALDKWVEALELVDRLSTEYLDAWESGSFDDFDSEQGFVAGQTARSAVDMLNAAGCV